MTPSDREAGSVLATSSRTAFARAPAGSRTFTFCSPTGSTSRIGPFIIIGFVRFTR